MTSLFLNAGMGILASMDFSGGAIDQKPTEGSVKVENILADKPVLVSTPKVLKKDKHGMPTYHDSQRRRQVRTTAYSHMENEPGAPGRKNAIGTNLKYGKKVRSAAADWSVYPVGTKFRIKGYSQVFQVDDYGSALAGTNTIDIYKPTLRLMRKWGTKKVEIKVIEWGSYERSRKILSHRTGYRHCRKMHNAIVRKLGRKKYVKNEGQKSLTL